MKTLIKIFTGLFFLILVLVLGAGGVLFFKPETLLNPKALNFALEKTNLLEEWSWDEATLSHEWISWNKRNLKGEFKNFCFVYSKKGTKAQSCLDTFSWDFNLSWTPGEGFGIETKKPITIDSKRLIVELAQKQEEAQEKEKDTTAPDIKMYWKLLWSEMFPKLDVNIERLAIKINGKKFASDLKIQKKQSELQVFAMGFELRAIEEGLKIEGPQKFKLPLDIVPLKKLHLNKFKLTARMKENFIPLRISGFLESVPIHIRSQIPLPIEEAFGSAAFLKKIALNTEASVDIESIPNLVGETARAPYDVLPAPFNALGGGLKIRGEVEEGGALDEVEININTSLDLDGPKQALKLDLLSKIIFNLNSFQTGAFFMDLDLRQVVLQLPRLPETTLPPQMGPDSRIHSSKMNFHQELAQKQVDEKPLDLNMKIQALGDNALNFRTNLLDEILRLNVDLLIEKGEIKDGYIKVLPLRTTFFKRDVHLKDLLIEFDAPNEPIIDAIIDFKLPEYTITLRLEGPVSGPRHSFSSEPPLPQADIYAVLLFGRPMMDLDAGDRDAAARTNQVLSQGILSLSVLYFFSGSPIEAVIYDPDSKEVRAQIGLDARSSLTVGGQGSVGVRYSLGGGWYIDTSSRRNESLDNTQTRDYGILLERIIAY